MKRMDAVAVQPVEQQMARQCDRDQTPQPQAIGCSKSPHCRHESVRQDQQKRQGNKTHDRVGVPAMVQQEAQGLGGDAGVRQVDIWKIRGDNARTKSETAV